MNHAAHNQKKGFQLFQDIFRTKGYQIQTCGQRRTNAFHKCYKYSPIAVFFAICLAAALIPSYK